MPARTPSTAAALCRFALVAAASVAAASIWATGVPEQGVLLDAAGWQQGQAAGAPADGWYRLLPQEQAVEVRAVHPADDAAVAGALFVRIPGAALKEGARPAYRDPALLRRVRLGQDYELSLAGRRFSVRVDSEAKGMHYAIGYAGATYEYLLGPFDAAGTAIRNVADLDGDANPDFVVEVESATYLLLSTRALPGFNRPAAELAGCGC